MVGAERQTVRGQQGEEVGGGRPAHRAPRTSRERWVGWKEAGHAVRVRG